MPKYVFADGKVLVEEGEYAPVLITKRQFTDSVVFFILRDADIRQKVRSVAVKGKSDVHKDP